MKKSNVIIAVILVAVLAVGAFALTKKSDKTQTAPTTSNTTSSKDNNSQTPQTADTTITYTNNGFEPATLTVKSGTTITIKNGSSSVLQFDSNPHPDHTDDPELNVGTISPGQSKTVTVTQIGNHGYHNHLNSGDTGTLIVN